MSIRQRGKNTYLIRVYVGRDPITKKRIEINVTEHGTRANAKKVEAQLKGQKEFGHLIKTSRMILNELFDSYLDSVRHVLAEVTRNNYRQQFFYYIRPYIGHLPLKQINTSVIQNMFNVLLDKREGRGISPGTATNVKIILSAVFHYAVDEKMIAENPVSKTRLPRVRGRRASSLTVEEAKAFISVRDDCPYGDAFVFQLHTGVRPQELMALIWEDVDFARGVVRIERACKWVRNGFTGFGPPKSENGYRTIDLSPDVLELLRDHFKKQQKIVEEHISRGLSYGEPKIKEWAMKERSGQAHLYSLARLIFPKSDGGVPSSTLPREAFKYMLQRAGITHGQSNYRWNDLRHTCATFLLDEGEKFKRVAERMGHTPTVLINYMHRLENEKHSASTALARLIPINSNPTEPPTEKN